MAKRTPRAKKTVTLNEFKAWLEGVEELQEKTWVPTDTQWKLIRAKINSIVADEPVQQVVQQQPQQPAYQQPVQHHHQPQQGTGLPPGVPPMPMAPSSIPMGEVEVGESAKQFGMQVKTGQNGEKVLKTPDIDGEYKNSQFG